MAKNLIYDIHDKPKFSKMLIFALQQVLAILAATIAVPTIIGLPTQIPAAIFGAGVGTLVYQLFTRFKSPVFLGSSFAFLNSLGVALAYGYCGIVIGSIVAGLVYVVIAIIIKIVGTAWVGKLLPPVIIGPTVALIGLSLAGSAMGDIVKANSSALFGGYNLVSLLCGLLTFVTIIILSSQKRYQMPRLIPFILGILVGYAAASIFTLVGLAADIDYLKIINWDPIVNNFVDAAGNFKGIEAIFSFPKFAIVGAFGELFGDGMSAEVMAATGGAATKIDLGGIVEVIIAFLPVALVVFAEHIADHKNLSYIIDKDLIEDPGLDNTLLGDGVGSIAGTLFGICPNTTYGESVGCVAITRNASVATITTTAIMCIVLSFISPVMALLQTIPSCVMGGVCLTLYGFIAVSGLKMFKDIDLNENKNLFVVAAILIAGIGGLTIQIPYAFAGNGAVAKTIQVTSIATALILGIVSNAILTKVEKSKLNKEAPAQAKESKNNSENK
ncbi:MAG: uracil-xanthine permease [Clostridia bacterium]|nr:uracil-xanthine permease [Clostridia bacterium]